MRTALLLALACLAPASTASDPGPQEAARASDPGRVRVVVLAGQSNMEGKATNDLFETQASVEATAAPFEHLRENGRWIVRDDVWVDFLGRRGGLTIGYGSPGRTGVELELGTVLGDAWDDPVLLVKTAWGGHSLFRQFRPPSSGVPEERIEADHEKAIARVKARNEQEQRTDPLPERAEFEAAYGVSYRAMIAEVGAALEQFDQRYPHWAGRRPELAGFVWHQGWNDQYEGAEVEYAGHLENLVRDLRGDLGAPDLPVVIGVMGQNMSKPAKGAMKVLQEAQLGLAEHPELGEHVRSVRTDVLVDTVAEELYPSWRENKEQWTRTGSDHPYHYLGSAIWHLRMGRAFGEALLEMD